VVVVTSSELLFIGVVQKTVVVLHINGLLLADGLFEVDFLKVLGLACLPVKYLLGRIHNILVFLRYLFVFSLCLRLQFHLLIGIKGP